MTIISETSALSKDPWWTLKLLPLDFCTHSSPSWNKTDLWQCNIISIFSAVMLTNFLPKYRAFSRWIKINIYPCITLDDDKYNIFFLLFFSAHPPLLDLWCHSGIKLVCVDEHLSHIYSVGDAYKVIPKSREYGHRKNITVTPCFY